MPAFNDKVEQHVKIYRYGRFQVKDLYMAPALRDMGMLRWKKSSRFWLKDRRGTLI